MNIFKNTQYVGYLSLSVGAVILIYNLSIPDTNQLIGFVGVVLVMFGVFKLIKRNDEIKREQEKIVEEEKDKL